MIETLHLPSTVYLEWDFVYCVVHESLMNHKYFSVLQYMHFKPSAIIKDSEIMVFVLGLNNNVFKLYATFHIEPQSATVLVTEHTT